MVLDQRKMAFRTGTLLIQSVNYALLDDVGPDKEAAK